MRAESMKGHWFEVLACVGLIALSGCGTAATEGEPTTVAAVAATTTTREATSETTTTSEATTTAADTTTTTAAPTTLAPYVSPSFAPYESSSSAPYEFPSPVVSGDEIDELAQAAGVLADGLYGSWPDNSAALERFADDVVFWDATDGDYTIEGGGEVTGMLSGFASYMRSAEPVAAGTFIAADAASYRVEIPLHYWPPWLQEPEEHHPVVELDAFTFESNEVKAYDIWYTADTLAMLPFGCFGVDACPQLGAIVDRYLTAWASNDSQQISAIYAHEAVMTDTLLGVEARGSAAISETAAQRFGTGEFTLEVVELYVQTDGPDIPTSSDPDVGEIIGIGIHYRLVPAGQEGGLESLALFEIGTRVHDHFETDPDNRIVSETVLHQPDTLSTIAK